MQLTVLGNNGPWPSCGGACSGYLVSDGPTHLLLDCGSGVLSRLQEHINPWELSAVIATHLHYDHISDLLVLRYALEAARQQGWREEPLPLYAPGQPAEVFASLPHKDLFQLQELLPEHHLQWDSLEVHFLPTSHPLPTLAVAVEGPGSKMVYTSDTQWFPELMPFCQDARFLLCEANLRQEDIAAGKGNHLSGQQAGELAARAGVERLLLTHLLPFADPEVLLQEARRFFLPAEIAQIGRTYNLSL